MLPLLEQQQLPAGWTQTSVRGGEMGVRNETHHLILQTEQIRSSNQRDVATSRNQRREIFGSLLFSLSLTRSSHVTSP